MKHINYQICSNCVMDTTDKNIIFDENGVCDHCNNYKENIEKDWENAINNQRFELLKDIAKKIKEDGKGQEYDCLIGISGGPDSSFMLHFVVNELNLRPLVFHVDGGWNTKSAVHNIKNLVTKLNLDLKVNVVDWEEMRDFQLAYFKSGMSNLDTPQDQAFMATLYNYADKNNIRYILNGGNISTENVQVPLDWIYYTTDMRLLNDISSKFMENKFKKFELSSALNHKFKLRYLKGIKLLKPLDFIRYIKEDALQLLESEYGYERFKNKHWESHFTKFYEGYWLPKRFNIDTRRVTFSSMILTKQITRENALQILETPAIDEIEGKKLSSYICKKLRIDSHQLDSYMNMNLKSYRDYKNHHLIYKIGAKIMGLLKEDISGKKR